MGVGRRIFSLVLRDAHQDGPQHSPLKAFLLVLGVPALGTVLGAVGGTVVAVLLLLGAGRGVGHSGAAAGIVLGMGAVCILVGGALGMGVSLALATLIRGGRFLLGRRPWPWRGSVHLGALLLAAAVVLGLDHLGRNPAARSPDGSGTVVRLAADVAGLVLAFPAVIVGGLMGSWIHRRRVGKRG